MDKNISPVDWYVGTYLARFILLEDKSNQDPEKKFLTWENTVIVKAKSLKEAYDKVNLLVFSMPNSTREALRAFP